MSKFKLERIKGGFDFNSKPYLEVSEYGPDSNGKFELDDEGDPKEGFYWRIMQAPGIPQGSEIGPYSALEDAHTAGCEAWLDGSF